LKENAYARRDLFSPAATFRSHKLCKVVAKKRARDSAIAFYLQWCEHGTKEWFESAYFWDKKKMGKVGDVAHYVLFKVLSFFH
jgi:hypothetical protein